MRIPRSIHQFGFEAQPGQFMASYVEPLTELFRSRIMHTDLRNAMCGSYDDFSTVDIHRFLQGDAACSPSDFKLASQMVSLQKKLPISSVQTLKAALKEAIRCEVDCREMNLVLASLTQQSHLCVLPSVALQLNPLIYEVSQEVSRILGDVPSWSELNYEFGPGACIGMPKAKANTANKLNIAHPTCSKSMHPVRDLFAAELPHLAESIRRCEPAPAKLDFVPKNRKTDRPIAVEPWLNVMVQKAIGAAITDRLRSIGVDVKDQSRNQRVAKYGSENGEYCTIDLSSASDTICSELIRLTFPEEWLEKLDIARSPELTFRGHVVPIAKYSSMGNGFTFPLQTLLFHAIGRVSLKRTGASSYLHSTYGDDIVIHKGAFTEMIANLRLLGFRPNEEKSFSTGRFRESCGGDYVDGENVRPVYAQDFKPFSLLFRLYNSYSDPYIKRFCLAFIPNELRIYGPPLYGDGHLHQYGFVGKRKNTHIGWCGHIFETFSEDCWADVIDLGLRPLDYVLPLYQIDQGLPSRQTEYRKGRAVLDRPVKMGYRKIAIYTWLTE